MSLEGKSIYVRIIPDMRERLHRLARIARCGVAKHASKNGGLYRMLCYNM